MALKLVLVSAIVALIRSQVSSSESAIVVRGIHPSLTALYQSGGPQTPFQCLDGSKTLPFHQVNDDYCDCQDGSDEPGTAACSNGKFYCSNVGHASLVLVSSRVNDGICDCCDGTDEWENNTCQNTCDEMGRAAREERERMQAIMKQGMIQRKDMQAKGKAMKAEKMESITTFEAEMAQALTEQEDKEKIKDEVEAREKILLDVYNEKKEAEREAREAEEKAKDQELAMETFNGMDANKDEVLQRDEAKTSPLFDQNNDGSVSEEELTFFMSDSEGHTKEDFLAGVWSLIKHRIKELAEKKEEQAEAHPPLENTDEETAGQVEEVAATDPEDQDYDGDYDDLDEDDARHQEAGDDFEAPPPEEDDHDRDDYDPETRAVVEEADAARSEFEAVRGRITELQEKINQAKNMVETDYGFAEEFATLKDQCFEFTDNEYTYKHCVFDYCEQKPKHGGSGTRLGKFEQWVHEGVEQGETSYSGMMYSGGQQCWNGPARSTKVLFKCGLENKLLSVTEPNKCEYEMVFETPASCSEQLNNQLTHDEL